jgi:hypothetical protein
LAVANYHDTKGHLPAPYLTNLNGQPTDSWRVSILPFIEGDDLFKQYRYEEPWNGPNNTQISARMPKIYSLHCLHKPGTTIANYTVIVGTDTAWPPQKRVTHADIKDGLSSTLGIVENHGLNIHWMEPRDLDFNTMDWTIDSPNGISSKYHLPGAVFLDGSVRGLSKNFTPEALRALATIAGGDWASDDGELMKEMRDGRDRPVTKP